MNVYENFQNIKVEIIDSKIAIVYLNRPEKMNAINVSLRNELEDAVKKIIEDKNIRVMVITGTETPSKKAFSAGDDLRNMGFEFSSPTVLSDYYNTANKILKIFDLIDNSPKPVIAMVNGVCIGGGVELALSCDFIFASESATFSFPEVNIGIIPGWGGTQRLTRRIGEPMAKMLILSGDSINARTAKEIGLVDIVVPDEKLKEITLNFAKKLADKNPIVLMMAKHAIEKGVECSLQSGLYYETLSLLLSIKAGDFEEGIKAFFEKRKPTFKMR